VPGEPGAVFEMAVAALFRSVDAAGRTAAAGMPCGGERHADAA
jgi:hypothetical protein